MAAPITKGRMINKDISDSKNFAQLSPEAAVLFCMLIPHYDSHGKMIGDPGYIKAVVCPRIPYLTYNNIGDLLQEISEKTNVKWFEHDGRHWVHSVKFLKEHQKLPPDKLGEDSLPDYPGLTPDLLQGKSRVPLFKEEVEEEVEEEGQKTLLSMSRKPASGEVQEHQKTNPKGKSSNRQLTDEEWMNALRCNPTYEGLDIDRLYGKMVAWCETNNKQPTRRRFVNWLNREDKPIGGNNGSDSGIQGAKRVKGAIDYSKYRSNT
ncbi:MAG: hypothetical protein K8I29_19735 [Alphaproteobacteria bacterium]|uniref:Uncharacterized protein n=1 Tax=Candidatus Nitrobium versatile TaxID=2884831 RepID=A0A953M3W7_9BACT|nr:hypothetical protein [Candidatus Nitrobium versatile]